MAAPILWAPGKCVLSAGKSHAHKISGFKEGGYFGLFWGGSTNFIFMDARILLIYIGFNKELRAPPAQKYAKLIIGAGAGMTVTPIIEISLPRKNPPASGP